MDTLYQQLQTIRQFQKRVLIVMGSLSFLSGCLLFISGSIQLTTSIEMTRIAMTSSKLAQIELEYTQTAVVKLTNLALTPTVTPTPTVIPTLMPVIDQKGHNMKLVPAGTFLMGTFDTEFFEDEQPERIVYLDDYYIDTYEVTNLQYATFLNEVGNLVKEEAYYLDTESSYVPIEKIADMWIPKKNYEFHPVTNVNWYGASAYCTWRDAHLPSEAQWEKAARGTNGYNFPWGNESTTGTELNFCDQQCDIFWQDITINDGYANTAPVGSYPDGVSPYQVHDLAGNVWEWTSDWYDEKYYSTAPTVNPVGPISGTRKVSRGGAWNTIVFLARTTVRGDSKPTSSFFNTGFRCAVPATLSN